MSINMLDQDIRKQYDQLSKKGKTDTGTFSDSTKPYTYHDQTDQIIESNLMDAQKILTDAKKALNAPVKKGTWDPNRVFQRSRRNVKRPRLLDCRTNEYKTEH